MPHCWAASTVQTSSLSGTEGTGAHDEPAVPLSISSVVVVPLVSSITTTIDGVVGKVRLWSVQQCFVIIVPDPC
jgi:hypothetical protein